MSGVTCLGVVEHFLISKIEKDFDGLFWADYAVHLIEYLESLVSKYERRVLDPQLTG